MDDLTENNESNNRQQSLNFIRFWLNSITVYTYDESKQIAASIIVIGTRKDKVKDTVEHQRISNLLNEEFKNIIAWKSIIKSTEGNCIEFNLSRAVVNIISTINNYTFFIH
jgi:hypothetical protein